MAGPYTLYQNQQQSIPTWHAGRKTQLHIKSANAEHYTSVRIQAGNAAEDLGVGGHNAVATIERDWGGLPITVTNNRFDANIPVEIWTV